MRFESGHFVWSLPFHVLAPWGGELRGSQWPPLKLPAPPVLGAGATPMTQAIGSGAEAILGGVPVSFLGLSR